MKLTNAKKCKCIKNYYYGGELLYESNDKLHEYKINTNGSIYIEYGNDGYCVFTKDMNNENTDYFYDYFSTIKEDRKLKIEKLNKIQ